MYTSCFSNSQARPITQRILKSPVPTCPVFAAAFAELNLQEKLPRPPHKKVSRTRPPAEPRGSGFLYYPEHLTTVCVPGKRPFCRIQGRILSDSTVLFVVASKQASNCHGTSILFDSSAGGFRAKHAHPETRTLRSDSWSLPKSLSLKRVEVSPKRGNLGKRGSNSVARTSGNYAFYSGLQWFTTSSAGLLKCSGIAVKYR